MYDAMLLTVSLSKHPGHPWREPSFRTRPEQGSRDVQIRLRALGDPELRSKEPFRIRIALTRLTVRNAVSYAGYSDCQTWEFPKIGDPNIVT